MYSCFLFKQFARERRCWGENPHVWNWRLMIPQNLKVSRKSLRLNPLMTIKLFQQNISQSWSSLYGLKHSGWRRFSQNRCHFSVLLILNVLGFVWLFSNLGQEASTGGVRIWRWRKRGLRHQCWHDWGWSLCIHVDLHGSVTRWTHKWANWLQASSRTSYATDAVWKFAVFIDGCAFL